MTSKTFCVNTFAIVMTLLLMCFVEILFCVPKILCRSMGSLETFQTTKSGIGSPVHIEVCPVDVNLKR